MSTDISPLFQEKLDSHAFFQNEEVTVDLAQEAIAFLTNYTGDFPFLRDVQYSFAQNGEGRLTAGQIRGVLNCMLNAYRDSSRASEAQSDQSSHRQPTPVNIRNGYYIVTLEDGEQRTIRVRQGHDDAADTQFVSFLTGPLEETDYQYCGTIKNNVYRWTRQFADNARSSTTLAQCIRFLITSDPTRLNYFGRTYAQETKRCYICNRLLKSDPISIATGAGSTCREANNIPELHPQKPEPQPARSYEAFVRDLMGASQL